MALLLNKGADPNVRDELGNVALIVAIPPTQLRPAGQGSGARHSGPLVQQARSMRMALRRHESEC